MNKTYKPFQIPKHWSPEMVKYVEDKYRRYGPKKFTKAFNRLFGTTYKPRIFMNAAQLLGCTEREAPVGFYTLKELAGLMGIARQNVKPYFERRGVSFKKMGRSWALATEIADPILQERLSKPEIKPAWPVITTEEAARRVDHSNAHSIREAINRGVLDHIRIDGKIFVRESDIQAAVAHLRRTKQSQVPWKKLKEGRRIG